MNVPASYSFDPGPDPELIRTKQKLRNSKTLGILTTITTIAVAGAVQVYREVHASSEKVALTELPADIKADLTFIKSQLQLFSERLTRLETERAIDAALKAAEEKRLADQKRKKKNRSADEE